MTKRKYTTFILESDTQSVMSFSWREVFSKYMRTNESATIYGLPNYDGADLEVIMSK